MIPPLVELALDYYRNPLAYGHLADGSFPLPRGFSEQFSALCSALSPLHIDATAHALNSSPEELEAAARFFARHVLLDPGADYYRALGASPRATSKLIREHYLFLIKLFHPDRLRDATEADIACSQRLNAAYHVLHEPDQRARYDRQDTDRKRRIRRSDPRDFFGHHTVPLESADAPPRHRLGATRWILVASIGVLGLVAFVAAVILWEPQAPRPLRATAPLAAAAEQPRPYYLRGSDTAEAAPSGAARQTTAGTAPNAKPVANAPARIAETDPRATLIGNRVTDELQIAFRRGDTGRLAALFAEPLPAVLPHPVKPWPRAPQGPTTSSEQLWLSFHEMAWRSTLDGGINGDGRIIVSKPSRNGATREVRGAVELELVPTESDYRIRRFRIQED
jgi:hypothetical protein